MIPYPPSPTTTTITQPYRLPILALVACLSFGTTLASPAPSKQDAPSVLLIDRLQVDLTQVAHDIGPSGDRGGFVCLCMDWWPGGRECRRDATTKNHSAMSTYNRSSEKDKDEHQCPWENASILTAPLDDPRLIQLVKSFNGLTLRLGGTLADSVYYQEQSQQGGTTKTATTEMAAEACSLLSSNINTADDEYPNLCLTRQRWSELAQFARDTQAKIVFGINAMYGRHGSSWDASNARQFLEMIRDNHDAPLLRALEYGNELFDFRNVTAKQQAAGMEQLKDLVQDVFGPNVSVPLWGPDVARWKEGPFMTEFVNLTKSTVEGITWHAYPLGGNYRDSGDHKQHQSRDNSTLYSPKEWAMIQMMRPDKMERLGEKQVRHIVQHQDLRIKNLRLIMGESGGAYHGGHPGLSNRFIDSFWYLKAMSVLAQNHHDMFCRQTLLGGFYGLIDPYTLKPNPSFWAARLYALLMGRQVWRTTVRRVNVERRGQHDGGLRGLQDVTHNSKTQLQQRVYANCHKHPGARLTILLLNYSPNATSTLQQLAGMLPGDLVPRDEYIVTADDLQSAQVLLNGKEMTQDLMPRVVHGAHEHVGVPPFSYGFFQFSTRSTISKRFCGGS